MKIFCIYPGLSVTNETAFLVSRLKDRGAKIIVVASKSKGLKGKGQLPSFEVINGVPVYRLYHNHLDMMLFPERHLKKILKLVDSLQPDLIFCAAELHMRLATIIQEHYPAPLVLLVEDGGRVYSGEAYSFKINLLLKMTGIPAGQKTWPWFCKKANTIISCHPRDPHILDKLSNYNAKIDYIPWPTHTPLNFELPTKIDRYRGVYIGSLYPFKNTQEFAMTLPEILRSTPTKEFVVVGPGPHSSMIKRLQESTSGKVKYIPELPREQALRLVASSYYAYTPVKKGGWGFIGDCWNMRTPIVLTHNDEYVRDSVNALVASNTSELVKCINRLYNEPDLCERLKQNGFEESRARMAPVIGDRFYDTFMRATRNQKGAKH